MTIGDITPLNLIVLLLFSFLPILFFFVLYGIVVVKIMQGHLLKRGIAILVAMIIIPFLISPQAISWSNLFMTFNLIVGFGITVIPSIIAGILFFGVVPNFFISKIQSRTEAEKDILIEGMVVVFYLILFVSLIASIFFFYWLYMPYLLSWLVTNTYGSKEIYTNSKQILSILFNVSKSPLLVSNIFNSLLSLYQSWGVSVQISKLINVIILIGEIYGGLTAIKKFTNWLLRKKGGVIKIIKY